MIGAANPHNHPLLRCGYASNGEASRINRVKAVCLVRQTVITHFGLDAMFKVIVLVVPMVCEYQFISKYHGGELHVKQTILYSDKSMEKLRWGAKL